MTSSVPTKVSELENDSGYVKMLRINQANTDPSSKVTLPKLSDASVYISVPLTVSGLAMIDIFHTIYVPSGTDARSYRVLLKQGGINLANILLYTYSTVGSSSSGTDEKFHTMFATELQGGEQIIIFSTDNTDNKLKLLGGEDNGYAVITVQ